MLHGDFWPKNILWQHDTQKIFLIDFEFMAFGHPAFDLCNFLRTLGPDLRMVYEDTFLESYRESMLAKGKVKPDQFTVQWLKKEIIARTLPR